jgi:hypothetical protein
MPRAPVEPHLNFFEDLKSAEHIPDVGIPADQRREEPRVGGHVQLAHLVNHLHCLIAEEVFVSAMLTEATFGDFLIQEAKRGVMFSLRILSIVFTP